jgi:uncharacterized protein (DUF305 family)
VDLPTTPGEQTTGQALSHEGALELAAASIDFELDPFEQEMLDHHLVACGMCSRTAAALRNDARRIAGLPRP